MDGSTFNRLCDFTEEAVKAWHRHQGLSTLDAQDGPGLDAHNKRYQEWLDFFAALRAAGELCIDIDEDDEE